MDLDRLSLEEDAWNKERNKVMATRGLFLS
jgi:hypothetical protein